MNDISEKLKMDILEGRFEDDFITESEVAEKYEATRSAAKEALVKLTHIGILSPIPRCGYKMISRTYKEYLDMLKVRLDIESMCIKEIIRKGTFDSKRLERLWQRGMNAKTIRETYLYNHDFHKELSKQSGISYVETVLDDIENKSARFFFRYYSSDYSAGTETPKDNHKLLIESIINGDEKHACSILQNDIMTVKEELEKLIGSTKNTVSGK